MSHQVTVAIRDARQRLVQESRVVCIVQLPNPIKRIVVVKTAFSKTAHIGVRCLLAIRRPNDQLTDGGPPEVFKLSTGAAGPPFGAAPGSAWPVSVWLISVSKR